MANKDIYDESFIPPILRRPGSSVSKFKQYFYESDYKRKPQINSFKDNNSLWNTKCHLIEPKEVIFNAKANKKKDSEAMAMAKALMWLRDNDFLDNSFAAIKLTTKQMKDFYDWTNRPIDVKPIDICLKNEMKEFCDSFDRQLKAKLIEISRKKVRISDNLNIDLDKDLDKELEKQLNEDLDTNECESNDNNSCSVVRSIFDYKPFEEPNETILIDREVELNLFVKQRTQFEQNDQNYGSLRQKVKELPINEFRAKILKTIEENRVVVISGDTGCGKTTQIPQMIFNNEIHSQRGAFANIVVTEPRRLSAIAISERIAQEFGEETVGNSIGYHVRFDKILPKHKNGAILFCSAGILLRKMGSNPSLKGVSHVIIDEVHERDVIIDFLMVLLKKALQMNPNIRVILMSASMNAHLFSQFFDCPTIEIPGRCHEVKHFYFNDFYHKISTNYAKNDLLFKNPKLDANLTINLINYIHEHKPDGAILCFLPGWAEIQSVLTELEKRNNGSNDMLILPVHSKLPHSTQKQIFAKTPVGVRKVVLSTNIAETSLTIDDVVYVIDSGLAKEMRYNSKLNVSNFGTNWISRANAKQRSGRAGRVREGECYRMFTPEIESTDMDEFPIPELLRIPLENIVMQAKLHCPNQMVAQFLSEVPQPPTPTAIAKAVRLLTELKILDSNENLTVLGKRIVSFSSHPRLSIALIYSSLFSCLKPMLPLVSQLSANREPFRLMPDEKHLIRDIKNKFSYDIMSDHISSVGLTLSYEELMEKEMELLVFREDNYLNRYSMEHILETMKQLATHLEDSQLICRESWKNVSSDVNFNWHRKQLIVSALVPAFVCNYVRLMRGEIKNQKIKTNTLYPIDVNTGAKVKFVGESVFNINFNSSPHLDHLSNGIVIYFGSFFSEMTRMLTICDGSLVSPISLLLFSENKFEFNFDPKLLESISNEECVVILRNNKNLQMKVNRDDLQVINRWIKCLELFFQWFIIPRHLSDSDIEENNKIMNFLQDFLQLTNQLIVESFH